MIRKSLTAILVALIASFALSSPVDAAPRRARAKHSSRAVAGTTHSTTKKKVVRKKRSTTAGKSTRKSTTKRRPTTKPH